MSMPCLAVDVAILLPDFRGGGAERVGINLANEFSNRGLAVELLVMNAVGDLSGLVGPDVRVVDFQIKRVRQLLVPLVRYLSSRRPFSLLACMWPLTILAIAARHLSFSPTRIVVAEHTTWSTAEESSDRCHRRLLELTMRWLYPLASGIVAVSEGAADDLASISGLPRDRVTAIYNPIVGCSVRRLPLGASVAPEWSLGPHKRVLAVGSLNTIKDYPTLLMAFALLRTSVDAKLLILGEGGERRRLEQTIVELSLGDSIFMPGFHPDPSSYFELADLHVLSSTGEGFGNVIVEALEAGTPVVSTDCRSGPREILENGRFGCLVPVGDARALADAMHEALLADHDSEALRDRAAEFSVETSANSYLRLLLPQALPAGATLPFRGTAP